jgi:hypothetical protein
MFVPIFTAGLLIGELGMMNGLCDNAPIRTPELKHLNPYDLPKMLIGSLKVAGIT